MFVTLEGTAGAGKTTLVDGLETELTERGFEVETVGEFSDTAFGDAFAEIVETGDRATFAQRALSLTLQSLTDDVLKVETEVIPALRTSDFVISERFVDRVVIYAVPLVADQYGAEDLAIELLDDVQALLPVRPDLRVFLTLDRAARRERYRSHRPELFDDEADIDRFQTRQQQYRDRVATRENAVTYRNDGSVADAVGELADIVESG